MCEKCKVSEWADSVRAEGKNVVAGADGFGFLDEGEIVERCDTEGEARHVAKIITDSLRVHILENGHVQLYCERNGENVGEACKCTHE